MAPLDRQHQTEFSAGRGNALQACAASLLERPLDEVPNFIASDDYWAAMLEDASMLKRSTAWRTSTECVSSWKVSG